MFVVEHSSRISSATTPWRNAAPSGTRTSTHGRYPVVAGTGDRLLDGLDLTHLKLIDSFASGIVVHALAPA